MLIVMMRVTGDADTLYADGSGVSVKEILRTVFSRPGFRKQFLGSANPKIKPAHNGCAVVLTHPRCRQPLVSIANTMQWDINAINHEGSLMLNKHSDHTNITSTEPWREDGAITESGSDFEDDSELTSMKCRLIMFHDADCALRAIESDPTQVFPLHSWAWRSAGDAGEVFRNVSFTVMGYTPDSILSNNSRTFFPFALWDGKDLFEQLACYLPKHRREQDEIINAGIIMDKSSTPTSRRVRAGVSSRVLETTMVILVLQPGLS